MEVYRRERMVDIISSLFVLLFVYAALSKILDFEKFRIELGKSPLLGPLSTYIAILVPLVELAISFLLFVKKLHLKALFAAFSVMTMFSAYIFFILKWSSYIPCSCGGVLGNMTWGQHLLFNIIYLIMGAVAIYLHPDKNQGLIRDSERVKMPLTKEK